jgi:PAS domain S-box-containing protein
MEDLAARLPIPQWLRDVFEVAPVIVWATDARGVFLLGRGGGLAALGLKPDQYVGQSVFDVYSWHPEISAAARRALKGQTFTVKLELGGRIFETWIGAMRDDADAVSGVLGVSTDVTQRAVDAAPQKTEPTAAGPYGLTAREREVVEYVVLGLTNAQIAAALDRSPNTIRNQLTSAFRKMSVASRAEAVYAWLRVGAPAGPPKGR